MDNEINNLPESLKTEEEIQDNEELSLDELNELMKYILLKDYFEII